MLDGSAADDVVAGMKRECNHLEYGWSGERYRDVLAAISARHNAPIRGFAGSSFAAVHLAWLSADPRFEISHAVLTNPLLPEMSADDVLRHQATAITRLWPAIVAKPGVTLPPGPLIAAVASQLASAASESSARAAHLSEPQLRSLADTYLGRYGDGKLSPGRLAYYQELCRTGFRPSTQVSWNGRHDDPYGFLALLHTGCPNGPVKRPTLLNSRIALCISISKYDQVVPFRGTEELLVKNDYEYHITEGPHSASASAHCRDFLTKVETP